MKKGKCVSFDKNCFGTDEASASRSVAPPCSPLWAVWGNGYGFHGPLRVFWDDGLMSWWAKNRNDNVDKPGLDWRRGHFSFSSASKYEVIAFAKGYATCSRVVRNTVSGTPSKAISQ